MFSLTDGDIFQLSFPQPEIKSPLSTYGIQISESRRNFARRICTRPWQACLAYYCRFSAKNEERAKEDGGRIATRTYKSVSGLGARTVPESESQLFCELEVKRRKERADGVGPDAPGWKEVSPRDFLLFFLDSFGEEKARYSE